jgi:hypothetical protein
VHIRQRKVRISVCAQRVTKAWTVEPPVLGLLSSVPNYQEYQIWNPSVTVRLIIFAHDSSGFLTDGCSARSLLTFTSPKGVVHNYLICGYCRGIFPERHFNISYIYLLNYVSYITFTQMYNRGFLNKSSEKWVVF